MSRGVIYATVQSGPYAGFTKAEMDTEWARYKTQLTQSGSRLMGASVNGNSYQFGPRSALSQVSPDFIAPSGTIAIRFGCTG
jgi:hypothetical protein